MAELHAGGVADMLAADVQLELRTSLAAQLAAHIVHAAHADLIQMLEGIGIEDAVFIIGRQELSGVVTAEAERHLGEVVGAEGEELGFLGDHVGGQRGARDLDHGAHEVAELHAVFGNDGVGGGLHNILDELELLHLFDELFEILLAHFHDHVEIHLDEAAVAVIGPTGIAAAHGNQQGILPAAEMFAGELFQHGDVRVDFVHGAPVLRFRCL